MDYCHLCHKQNNTTKNPEKKWEKKQVISNRCPPAPRNISASSPSQSSLDASSDSQLSQVRCASVRVDSQLDQSLNHQLLPYSNFSNSLISREINSLGRAEVTQG
jgi:hypothetical protein